MILRFPKELEKAYQAGKALITGLGKAKFGSEFAIGDVNWATDIRSCPSR